MFSKMRRITWSILGADIMEARVDEEVAAIMPIRTRGDQTEIVAMTYHITVTLSID